MASATRKYDCLVFGGGLAGSILAYTMISKGIRALLIDEPNRSTCSRVAAGLINPIGGRRLNPIWMADTLIPFARSFYESVEEQFSRPFFHPRSIARIFANDEERTIWQGRKSDPRFAEWTEPLDIASIPNSFDIQSQDGFSIRAAGYLDTQSLLSSLRSFFESRMLLRAESFDYRDIDISEDGIVWQDCEASRAIFCEGHLATANPWFSFAPYKPAKGVIGTISSDIEFGDTAILKKYFIIPRHDGALQVGATYNWSERDDNPDPEGIQELEGFLKAHLGDSWQWRNVRAGVRPATAGAKPLVGPSPVNPNIISFNGFGSKGAVQIPYFAKALCDFIARGDPIPAEATPARFSKPDKAKPKRWVAVEIARDRVLQHIQKGDWVIDATAGNGRDTLWLARKTGPSGRVFAFDVQEEAIVATRTRLESENCDRQVTLINDSHANLGERIPNEALFSAIVFNLGYLPGSDKRIITHSESTLSALGQAIETISANGILSVVLYPGHKGGDDESDEVATWAKTLDSNRYAIEFQRHPTRKDQAPFVLFVTLRDNRSPE